MMRYVATSPLLGRLASANNGDTSICVAATVCDGSAGYLVNGQTYTRALYTAGLVVGSDTRAKDVLDDLAKAMAGRWCFIDGQLRVRAGAYITPLQNLDDTWLAGGQAVQVQPKAARGDVFNVVSGKFSDESRDYIVTDYPRVTASAYVTEDGAELPIDVQLNAVTFVGQAQQVMAAQMRDARQGLRLTVLCNMRAYPVEPFDTLNVTLARFGWVNKAFEVLDVSWTIDGGIQLVMKETDPSIWALGTSFAAGDPAPNTLFPSPFKVPAVTSLACASGTGQLLKQADGTIQTRVQVTWDAMVDALVLQGGGVEVRYGLATAPESAWQSQMANDGQATVFLTENLRDGQLYLVKARATNALVNGAWCLPVLHRVVGKSAAPGNVASLAAVNVNGDVIIGWTANVEADYDYTELRYGASWAAGTFIAHVTGSAFPWAYPSTPGAGSVTIWAKHYDTSANPSATAASTSVTITAPTLGGLDSTAGTKLSGIASGATKNIVSYGSSAPGGPTDGDLWCDTSATPAVWKIRVSGAWQPAANYTTGALANLNTVGTAQIDANAATEVNTQAISGVTVSALTGVPNNTSFFWTDIATYTFTAAHTGSVTVTAIGGMDIATGGSGFGRAVLTTSLDVGSTYGGDQVYQVDVSIGLSASYKGSFAHTREIAVTAGNSYTVTLRAQKFEVGTTTVMSQGAMRTEQIKR